MEKITSLNSPHIERVKALLGSRSKKTRDSESTFVVEGIQAVREAISPKLNEGLSLKTIYVTEVGLSKLSSAIGQKVLEGLDIIEVSEQVMNAMADSQTPQGILALCSTKSLKLSDLWKLEPKKIAFFGRFKIQEMQERLLGLQMPVGLMLLYSRRRALIFLIQKLSEQVLVRCGIFQ